MSNASDIKNLFAKFGGHPEHYRELAIENDAQASAARWPLLSTIVANRASHPPPVSPSPFQAKPKSPATPGPEAATTPGPTRPPYLGFSAARQTHAAPTAAVAPAALAGQAPPPVARPTPAVAPVAQAAASTPLQSLLQRLSAPPPPQAQPAAAANPLAERGAAPVSTLLSRLAKR